MDALQKLQHYRQRLQTIKAEISQDPELARAAEIAETVSVHECGRCIDDVTGWLEHFAYLIMENDGLL